jgi:hypothetical protein
MISPRLRHRVTTFVGDLRLVRTAGDCDSSVALGRGVAVDHGKVLRSPVPRSGPGPDTVPGMDMSLLISLLPTYACPGYETHLNSMSRSSPRVITPPATPSDANPAVGSNLRSPKRPRPAVSDILLLQVVFCQARPFGVAAVDGLLVGRPGASNIPQLSKQ